MIFWIIAGIYLLSVLILFLMATAVKEDIFHDKPLLRLVVAFITPLLLLLDLIEYPIRKVWRIFHRDGRPIW